DTLITFLNALVDSLRSLWWIRGLVSPGGVHISTLFIHLHRFSHILASACPCALTELRLSWNMEEEEGAAAAGRGAGGGRPSLTPSINTWTEPSESVNP
ncbi:hypothetical protein INR49_019194, partial [Caranx melampygus]